MAKIDRTNAERQRRYIQRLKEKATGVTNGHSPEQAIAVTNGYDRVPELERQIDDLKRQVAERDDRLRQNEEEAEYLATDDKTAKSNRKNLFLMNCAASVQIVKEGYTGPIDEQVRIAASRAADAWAQLADDLRRKLGMQSPANVRGNKREVQQH
jgi:hypothetical protein